MNRSVLIAVVFAIAATVWVLSGTVGGVPDSPERSTSVSNEVLEQQDRRDENTQSDSEHFKVKVKHIRAENFVENLVLQGDIQALREIEIKAETRGTIDRLDSKKGEVVSVNQEILKISTDDRQARLEQAKAELKVREADLRAGIKLREKKLLSENQHEQNQANVVAAKASVKQIQVELQQTKVTAAFAGILDDLHVELGDYVSPGDPLARLVDHSKILISAKVPQQHISKVALGQTVSAELLSGQKVAGKVSYISSSAETETRTFSIEAEADNSANPLLHFGQSAQVTLEFGKIKAHKISPSHLDLASSGELRVKGVDSEGQVVTRSVEILRNESDGIWVSGIPEEFQLIIVGQGFVSSGDQVSIQLEDTSSDAPAS